MTFDDILILANITVKDHVFVQAKHLGKVKSNFEPTVKAKRNQTPLVSCSARNTQVKKFQPATVRDEKTDFGHKTCKYLKY